MDSYHIYRLNYVGLHHSIFPNMITLEDQSYQSLEEARELLHQTTSRNEKFDCLQTIISRCRSLKIDPLPYLKSKSDHIEKTIQNSEVLNCEYCEFTTDKGIQSLRAHMGMKHKKKTENGEKI